MVLEKVKLSSHYRARLIKINGRQRLIAKCCLQILSKFGYSFLHFENVDVMRLIQTHMLIVTEFVASKPKCVLNLS